VIDTVELPLIVLVHAVAPLVVAKTVKVVLSVCEPKDIGEPVPATAVPTAVEPLYSW
jgi:hypothetical protein